MNRCTRLSNWFWGTDERMWRYESRHLIHPIGISVIRALFLIIVMFNEIYRLVYMTIDDEVAFDQLYFTTWSYYMTIYTCTFNLLTGLYILKKGYFFDSRAFSYIVRHNMLVFSIAWASESLTTVIFWTGLYEPRRVTAKEFSTMFDHFGPLLVLVTDFILVGWVFKFTYILALLVLFALYVPMNAAYSRITDHPIYDILDWKSIGTLIWMVLIIIVVLLAFVIFWAISQCRYKRYVRKLGQVNASDKSSVSNVEMNNIELNTPHYQIEASIKPESNA